MNIWADYLILPGVDGNRKRERRTQMEQKGLHCRTRVTRLNMTDDDCCGDILIFIALIG